MVICVGLCKFIAIGKVIKNRQQFLTATRIKSFMPFVSEGTPIVRSRNRRRETKVNKGWGKCSQDGRRQTREKF